MDPWDEGDQGCQLAVIVLIVVLAVKAYNGETVRLPLVASIADENT